MDDKKITLRELRELSGKTIAEVAKALGVSHQSISNYELGIRYIGLEQVLLLSDLYEADPREVIEAQFNSRCGREDSQLSLRKNHKEE